MLRRGLDSKMERILSSRSLLLDVGERPVVRIDAEQYDTVVAVIGQIKVLAGRMHPHLHRGVRAVKILRQRGDGLPFAQDSRLRVVGENGDSRVPPVDDVGKTPGRDTIRRGPAPALTDVKPGSPGLSSPCCASNR